MSRYSREQRAEAVALATSIGPLKAARQLGLPPSTVAFWTHQPAASSIIAAAEQTIASRLSAAHEKALASVLDGLDAPGTRLGDRATALRVLGEQSALANGRATANVNVNASSGSVVPEHVTMDERVFIAHWIDAVLAERARVRAERGIGAGEVYGMEHHRGLAVDREIIDDAVSAERRRLAGLDADDPIWSEVDDVPLRPEPPIREPERDGPVVLIMDGPAPSQDAKRVGPPPPPEPPKAEPRRLVNLSTGELVRRP